MEKIHNYGGDCDIPLLVISRINGKISKAIDFKI